MTSDIRAHLDILCPDHAASRHLSTFIDQHAVNDDVAAVTLRLSKKTSGNCRPPLESRVYATLTAPRAASAPGQTYSVDLAHDANRALPYFSGALAVHAGAADDCVAFSLAGRYMPTGGIADTPSAFALGRRLAQASASRLLHTVARYVKVASARNEAARAGKRPHHPPCAVMELMRQH